MKKIIMLLLTVLTTTSNALAMSAAEFDALYSEKVVAHVQELIKDITYHHCGTIPHDDWDVTISCDSILSCYAITGAYINNELDNCLISGAVPTFGPSKTRAQRARAYLGGYIDLRNQLVQ